MHRIALPCAHRTLAAAYACTHTGSLARTQKCWEMLGRVRIVHIGYRVTWLSCQLACGIATECCRISAEVVTQMTVRQSTECELGEKALHKVEQNQRANEHVNHSCQFHVNQLARISRARKCTQAPATSEAHGYQTAVRQLSRMWKRSACLPTDPSSNVKQKMHFLLSQVCP